MSATEYLGIAGLLMLSERNVQYPEDRTQLAERFESTYNWKCDAAVCDRLVRQMEAWGAITINNDKYAGETFRVFDDNLREAKSLVRNSKLSSILHTAEYGGAPWFKKVFDNRKFWEELHGERDYPIRRDPDPITFDLGNLEESVPAADRIVLRTDNYETLNEVEKSLDLISQELRTDNEVGAEIGDLREVLELEVAVAKEVIEKSRFRLSSLLGWLMPALRFLIEKFSASAIGETAKHLVNLLEKLL